MPKLNNRLPSYRLHKASGQAIVTFSEVSKRDVFQIRFCTNSRSILNTRPLMEFLVVISLKREFLVNNRGWYFCIILGFQGWYFCILLAILPMEINDQRQAPTIQKMLARFTRNEPAYFCQSFAFTLYVAGIQLKYISDPRSFAASP